MLSGGKVPSSRNISSEDPHLDDAEIDGLPFARGHRARMS